MSTKTLERATMLDIEIAIAERMRVFYQTDIIAFVHDQLHMTPTPDQEEGLLSCLNNQQTYIKAGMGTGKTTLAAAAAIHTVECFDGSEVITSAPTMKQVEHIFKEMRMFNSVATPPLRGVFLPRECLWRVAPDHYAIGKTAETQEGFQGDHTRGRFLLVVDEGSAAPPYLYDAATGMLQGEDAHLLVISNPLVNSGNFYNAFTGGGANKTLLTMKPTDHPNIIYALSVLGITWEDFLWSPYGTYSLPAGYRDPIPGAISLVTLDSYKIEFLGVESAKWQIYVNGEFPTDDSLAIFNINWIEKARKNYDKEDETILPKRCSPLEGKFAGLDVAGQGSDRTVLTKMTDAHVDSITAVSGHTLVQIEKMVFAAIEEGYVVNLDEGGLGSGITDHILEMARAKGLRWESGVQIRPNNAGWSAEYTQDFDSMRDQLWHMCADYMRCGTIDFSAISEEDYRTLKSELLSCQTMGVTTKSHLRIETKDRMRKRTGKSPDFADSLCLATWRPVPPIGMTLWQQPRDKDKFDVRTAQW